jgi:salicylate hydroxylase
LARYDNIPDALKAYEKQRLPRAAAITANTRIHQDWLHLYDGPDREERDRLMTKNSKDNPIFWAYTARKDWLFGYDAEQLLEDDALNIPELPPLPPSHASVYHGGGGAIQAQL